MNKAELVAALNTLARYSEVAKNYSQSVEKDSWGDYVRVDDLAKLLGLVVDAYFDENRNTSNGFNMPK